jgi:hypothetical protein
VKKYLVLVCWFCVWSCCSVVLAQDSLNVRRLGQMPLSLSQGVTVEGNYAYIARSSYGLWIVNVANPMAPSTAGSYDTPGNAKSVTLEGNMAYVADGDDGLWIINVSNPATPLPIGSYDGIGISGSCDAAVGGNYAYVAYWDSLRIVNISNPSAPSLTGSARVFRCCYDYQAIAVRGNYTFLANRDDGLRIFDVANPSNPLEVAHYDTPGDTKGIAVSGNYAYLADGLPGLRILDVSDPATPVQVGIIDTPDLATGVVVSGVFAFVADNQSGLRVINISNPATPIETGHYNTPGNALDVAVVSSIAYVADGNYLGIYDCTQATSHVTVASPNGGENWRLLSTDTVRWSSLDITGPLRIEMKHHFPLGAWELLADSTANDGSEPILVTGPISDSCRIRISTVDGAHVDTSDVNFRITASQGYLALGLSSQPTTPILSWNAGSAECPQTPWITVRLKNFGAEQLTAWTPQLVNGTDFALDSDCWPSVVLAAGQMSTCSLRVTFMPQADGIRYDTLRIQSDAINAVNGYVIIPLQGMRLRTPQAPQIVEQVLGNDVRLYWPPVVHSLGSCPVDVTRYLVFFSEVETGPYWYHGGTTDTAYVHRWAAQYASAMFYHVIASTSPINLLQQLPPNGATATVTEDQVRELLRKSSVEAAFSMK